MIHYTATAYIILSMHWTWTCSLLDYWKENAILSHLYVYACMGEFSLSGQHHALLPIALFILVFVHPEYTIDFLLNYNSPITPQGGGKTIMEKCINKSPYIYNGHRSTKLDF